MNTDNFDFFISHASEDKESFVRDFARYLIKCGTSVFYDELSLKVGDSLSENINRGISKSKNALLILSEAFLAKNWPIAELNAILSLSISKKCKIIPIFHNINVERVQSVYPMISDLLGIDSKLGFVECAERIFKATDVKGKLSYFSFGEINEGEQFDEGWHLFACIAFEDTGIKRNQVIMDFGNPTIQKTRFTLLRGNNSLQLVVSDKNDRKITLGADISGWKNSEFHFIVANIRRDGILNMFIDEEKVDSAKVDGFDFDERFTNGIKCYVGCDLNHMFPAFISCRVHAIGGFLSDDNVTAFIRNTRQLFKSLGIQQ